MIYLFPIGLFLLIWLVLAFEYGYRLLRKSQQEISDLKKALYGEPDSQSLSKAIRFIIEQTEFGRRKTEDEVFADMRRLGVGEGLVIQGRKGKQFAQMVQSAEDSHEKIPAKFLETCVVFRDKNRNILSLIESVDAREMRAGKVLWSAYFEPRVSMKEIRHHYPMST